MSSPECIVLDFDGTFTRVEEEAVPFEEAFRRGLGERFPEVAARWDRARDEVERSPDRYGREHDGLVVAPSHADPYVRCAAIGQILLDEAGVRRGERTEILDALHRAAYPLCHTVFRPEAGAVLGALAATSIPTFVVTNSATHQVEAKLQALTAGRGAIVVRGDARKFVLHEPDRRDPAFDALPEHIAVSGLERPIYLRRGHYFEALRRIWDETGAGPERTLVCGDIFELDLAMPAHLGAQVHLVTRPTTPDYERRAVRAMIGGSTSADLGGLLARLELPG